MAELILGALAFGLGTPGVIVAFAQCGDYLHRKVETFKNTPAIIQELGKFGYELHQGKIKLNLELAEWAYSFENIDQVIKDAIDEHISKLRTLVMEVDRYLRNMTDKNGQVRRLYFTLIGERKVQYVVKSLKDWQNDFFNTICLIEMRNRVLPQDASLSRDRYRLKACSQVSTHVDLLIGSAEIMRKNEATAISVLIEKKLIHDPNTISDVKEVAKILSSRSFLNQSGGGILKCLGYREQDQKAELVFELPASSRAPRFLYDVITADQGKIYGGLYPLDAKNHLARQLCDTVFSVFTSGLVHKNLRTNTILLIVEDGQKYNTEGSPSSLLNMLGVPYLTTWTLLRKATGLTSGQGDSDTVENFYRYPKRQGLQPEQRYNFGHDIYSLGVCLLEIGLWEPFFTTNGEVSLSATYSETAVRLGHVKPAHADNIDQLTWPAVVPKVLLHLAEHAIPQRMGTAFSQLVVSCLTCLDGGMGDPECFKKSQPEAAIRFNELVSQTFTSV